MENKVQNTTGNNANTVLPTGRFHKVKKWNWGLFVVILLVCCIGVLGNKSITNIRDGLILFAGFGIPIGLLWAWLTRDN